MAILLTGGTVVNADAAFPANVKIDGEKIVSVGSDLRPETGDTTVDVSGTYLFPGMIDVHTHLDLSTGAARTADDFPSGTKAAIAGGTTAIVDFATQDQGGTLRDALAEWHEKASKGAYCDYGFHMAIVDWNPETRREMQEMLNSGVSSFKLYMAYKGSLQVDDGVIYEALLRARELGALIGFHCENGDLVEALKKQLLDAKKTSPYYHPLSRPDTVEEEAIFRLGKTAKLAGAPVWVVHLSTEKGLNVIRRLRKEGVRVVTETCPQYLLLDDSRYGGPQDESFEGAKYVISPPLRKPGDAAALWQALQSGEIDLVSTDHCAFHFKGQKELGRNDFTKIPNGASGLEHRLVLLYSFGVCENRLKLTDLVRLLSQAPGELFGFEDKGAIAPGKDADIVVFDPRKEWVISAASQVQTADYTPYEGMQARGKVRQVFLRGREVFADGCFTAEGPTGAFRKRRAFDQGK